MSLMRNLAMAAVLIALCTGAVTAQKKPKIKDTVNFAPTWEAAVSEAKLLNLPLVVHSHGFF